MRSQQADRPHIHAEEYHDVPLRLDNSQAFAYNRLLATQRFAFLSLDGALLDTSTVDQFFKRLMVGATSPYELGSDAH